MKLYGAKSDNLQDGQDHNPRHRHLPECLLILSDPENPRPILTANHVSP